MALLLGLFVVGLALTTLARMRTVGRRLEARSDALVAMRTARRVLRRELANGRAGVDWLADTDSIALRGFRGTALVCPRDSVTDQITVSFVGERRPDPSKDSVLLLDASGDAEVRALVAATGAADGCGAVPDTALDRWRLDAPVAASVVVARLFERGSYHLASSALRYRRGLSGRQPLTPDSWSDATGWTLSGARLGIRAEPKDSTYGPSWSAFLAWVP